MVYFNLKVFPLFFGIALIADCALGKETLKALPDSKPIRAIETLERAVTGIVRDGERVLLLPLGKSFVIETPFRPQAPTRQAAFGGATDSVRKEVLKKRQEVEWRGIDVLGNKVLLLDGESLTVIEAASDTLKEVRRRSVPWDLLKPPRDRGGEATAIETQALRGLAKRRFNETRGLKIAGMTRLPASWERSTKHQYLLVTRIPDFPLVVMECEADDPTHCVIARRCYLEGASDLSPESISGIAASDSAKMILIGDAKKRRLLSFRYHSCFHVMRHDAIVLPEKLTPEPKTESVLSNIYIDDERRLWVTLLQPDDYYSASVHAWDADVWQPFL